jgi:WD40 repeat protein
MSKKMPSQQQQQQQQQEESARKMKRPARADASSSLQCLTVLQPPPCQLGEGDNKLVYHSSQPAWQCCFSRDGRHLAVCYGAPDPCVRIWKQQEAPPTPTAAGASSSSEDHRDNGGGGGGSHHHQQQQQWKLEATLSGIHDRTVRSLAFAPLLSPLILATASFDGTVAIWEDVSRHGGTAAEEAEYDCIAQLEGHDNEVKCVAWNSTGSLLATGGRDKSVWIWECFLPGTVGGDAGGDFDCVAVLNGHEADVKCCAFCPSHGQWGDGDEILLTGSYDDTIKVWAEDAGDWYLAASLSHVHSSTIWSLAVSPSGTRLVSGSADGSLAIYKCYSSTERKDRFPNDRETTNNNSSGGNGLWKCVGKLPDAHSAEVYSVSYAPAKAGHGRICSAGADNRIQIYREAMGSSSDQPTFLLDAAATITTGDINCCAWHPYDGSLLASAGDDGAARIWKYKV